METGPGATQSPIEWLLGAVLPGVNHAKSDEKCTENISGHTRRKEPTSQTYMQMRGEAIIKGEANPAFH
jgi:hypothetical protein